MKVKEKIEKLKHLLEVLNGCEAKGGGYYFIYEGWYTGGLCHLYAKVHNASWCFLEIDFPELKTFRTTPPEWMFWFNTVTERKQALEKTIELLTKQI